MKLFYIALQLVFLTMANAAPIKGIPAEKVYNIKNCKITFQTTSSPDLVNIEGMGASCYGQIREMSGLLMGSIRSDLKDFDTGISLRNEHMRNKYLEIKKYPYAELVFVEQKDNGVFDAQLSIKTDKRPVKVIYKKTTDGIHAKFNFEIKDFSSIGVPSYLGISVVGIANVNVTFDLGN